MQGAIFHAPLQLGTFVSQRLCQVGRQLSAKVCAAPAVFGEFAATDAALWLRTSRDPARPSVVADPEVGLGAIEKAVRDAATVPEHRPLSQVRVAVGSAVQRREWLRRRSGRRVAQRPPR